MAKYNVQIEFAGSGNGHYQQLNTDLKKETGKKIKLFPAKPADKIAEKAEYEIEGNISIHHLGSLVSKVLTKSNKNFSFTILRKKGAPDN